jgi:hypothetical protein
MGVWAGGAHAEIARNALTHSQRRNVRIISLHPKRKRGFQIRSTPNIGPILQLTASNRD